MAEKRKKPRADEVRFAHRSEMEFARLLDFYDIPWEYEPRSFDIGWDRRGDVISRFRPDFYLPAYDLYIELTTLSQKLVTKKNRKIRLLKQLYPEIRCKIFYQKDYRKLLFKYGINDEPDPGEVVVKKPALPRAQAAERAEETGEPRLSS
ncbi:MAG: PDDEXK family nuclease [Candidatus Geothermincolia bacterium]